MYDRLSATNNLRFSCWLYGIPETRTDEVLDLAHLARGSRDPVRTFSYGMKHRLMVAQTLLHKPPVLFIDEPTHGLDPIAAREMRESIHQFSQEGITILLATHLLEEADQLCDRVAFIVSDHIVANAEIFQAG